MKIRKQNIKHYSRMILKTSPEYQNLVGKKETLLWSHETKEEPSIAETKNNIDSPLEPVQPKLHRSANNTTTTNVNRNIRNRNNSHSPILHQSAKDYIKGRAQQSRPTLKRTLSYKTDLISNFKRSNIETVEKGPIKGENLKQEDDAKLMKANRSYAHMRRITLQ